MCLQGDESISKRNTEEVKSHKLRDIPHTQALCLWSAHTKLGFLLLRYESQPPHIPGAELQHHHNKSRRGRLITCGNLIRLALFIQRDKSKQGIKSARPLGQMRFGKVRGSCRPLKAWHAARVTCRQLYRSESGKLLYLLWQTGTRGDTEGTAL